MRAFTVPDCCGRDCQSFEDTFDRADSTSIGGDWNEASGNWQIASNILQPDVGDTNAVVHITDAFLDENVKVTVQIQHNVDGDRARVILDYVDNNNYFFFEIMSGGAGTGAFRLYQRSGGSNTLLSELTLTVGTGSFQVYEACIGGGRFTAGIQGTASKLGALITPSSPGSGFVGLGTGATVANAIYFNDFVAEEVRDNCEECPCGGCMFEPDLGEFNGCCTQCDWTEEYEVTVSAVNWIVNGSSTCDCDALIDSFILTRDPQNSRCFWRYEIDDFCTDGPDGVAASFTLTFTLGRQKTDDQDECAWFLTITLSDGAGNTITASYASSDPASEDVSESCNLGSPVTLNNISSQIVGNVPCYADLGVIANSVTIQSV